MLNDYTDEQRFKLLIDHLIEWTIYQYSVIPPIIEKTNSALFNINMFNIDIIFTEKGNEYFSQLVSLYDEENAADHLGLRLKWLAAELELKFKKEFIDKVKNNFNSMLSHCILGTDKNINSLYKKYNFVWILHILQIAHREALSKQLIKFEKT